MVIRRGKPLAVALFGVIALAILVACGGGGTTESAKSSDPQTASGSDSPLAVLEVWPESHWPGFALRQADVFQSYTV